MMNTESEKRVHEGLNTVRIAAAFLLLSLEGQIGGIAQQSKVSLTQHELLPTRIKRVLI